MEVALIDGLLVRLGGPPKARILVLIHAFADSGLAFLPLFDTSLASRFRLVAPDLPGFGASPRREGIETLAGHAGAIAALVRSLDATMPVGLVAHSVASMIAVDTAHCLAGRFAGLFSIEGNLTASDAYFSGRAADFEHPKEFKRRFLEDIWAMAETRHVFRQYFASAVAADAVAMWNLGRDARRLSVGDAPGRAYGSVRPSLYYWSVANTTEASRQWIEGSGLAHRQFTDASHWPMIDQPHATAAAMESFFGNR